MLLQQAGEIDPLLSSTLLHLLVRWSVRVDANLYTYTQSSSSRYSKQQQQRQLRSPMTPRYTRPYACLVNKYMHAKESSIQLAGIPTRIDVDGDYWFMVGSMVFDGKQNTRCGCIFVSNWNS